MAAATVTPATGLRRLALLGGSTTAADCGVALRALARPGELVEGGAIAPYEAAFAALVGLPHALSFASGRVGLYGILHALGIGAGDEVLVQAPTHMVVANAIRYTGATPVFVDCELATYNVDLADAETRVTERTRALVLQHTFGIPVDLDAAGAFADRHGLVLVEDCVHALGARWRGRLVGSFGRAAFFSSEETKTISTTLGGMVVTGDDGLAARLRELQAGAEWPTAWLAARYALKLVVYHLLTEPHVHRAARAAYEGAGRRNPLPVPVSRDEMRGGRPAGYVRRLSNAQARLGLSQLATLDENLAHRRRVARAYEDALRGRGIRVPEPPEAAEPAYVRYPVWVPDREAALREVGRHTVVGTWFTSTLEESETPGHGGYVDGSCPRAEEAARHLINLPTHRRVTDRDVEALVDAVARVA